MTDAATLDGKRVSTGAIHVPPVGPWWADLVLEEAGAVSGTVDLVAAGGTFRGTVLEASSGVFADRRHVRLVAGAGAWGALLPSRAYHSDGQVGASQVAQDAASEAGETLGGFAPTLSTVGVDFVREAGPASKALEAAIGGAAWWVDFAGVTQVGTRAASSPDSAAFELLEFDPISRMATLALDDVSALSIGSILPADERLGAAQTIREMQIELSTDSLTVHAWCGAAAGTRSREAAALERIVESVITRRLLVPREYRVFQMNADRVDLQASSAGIPDLQAISMRIAPGIAAKLTPGSLVIVQWIDGDRARPVITSTIGKDGNGWAPLTLSLDATQASAGIVIGAGASEVPAWASKLKDELDAIATSFAGAQAPAGAGGGPLIWPVPLAQYGLPGRPVPAASALGATKTVIA